MLKYVDLGVATALFFASLGAYLYHGDDVTKGLVAATVGAVLTLLRANG